MRDIPSALQTKLDSGVTTLCHFWKLTRRDGVVQGFTDHDDDLVIDGVTYKASTGFTSSEATSRFDLSVDGTEIAGALSDDALLESDLAAGRYDAAAVETWLVESAEEAAALRAACGDGDDAWITTRRHVVLGGAPLTAADAGFGIVMVVGMCRREGMALDTFQRHWLGEHARITLAAPGTSRYEIALPIVDEYAAGAPALDGLAELWWCSQADLDAYLDSPAMAAVGADMETFVSPERALYSLYSTRGLTWLTGEAATAGKERR